MAQIASEALVERLADWGVDTVFGLPGDGINGIMEAFRRHQDRIRFVLVHHEEAAAFMATAHAKATGRLGVCLATSGPGGIHLLNGLYDAKLDHMPVLAITGMQETSVLGTGYQQEVNLDKLYQDVAGYDQMIYNPAQLPAVVDIAVRTAYARRGVAHLTLPNDIQVADAGAEPVCRRRPGPAAVDRADPARRPGPAARGGPAAAGRRAQRRREDRHPGRRGRPARAAGTARRGRDPRRPDRQDAARQGGRARRLALHDRRHRPARHHALRGAHGRHRHAVHGGHQLPLHQAHAGAGQASIVQIEADPARAGARVPTEVPVVGDAREGLAALLPLLKQRSDTSFLEKCQKPMAKWRENMPALQNADRDPIAPQYLVSVLDELAADDAVLTCDSGTIATWAARHWDIRGDRQFYLSGNLATMAPGLPYAIGIQHAFPGRQVIGYVGDGGFAMLMAEFITAVQHELPVKIVINNNNSLGQILWEQMVLGYPEYGVRYPEPPVNYTALATANGGPGDQGDQPGELRTRSGRRSATTGPALVDVDVNPDEPPLPGKVEYQQAKKFAEAFLRGQPHKATIATTLFRDKIEQFRA